MPPLTPRQVRRARRWMTIVLLGLFIFVIGVQPDILGLNRSLTVGFVQIGVWLTGLAILLLASYATVRVVRNGKPTSLRADIGTRLLATGYVVAAVASLADFIGVGAFAVNDKPQLRLIKIICKGGEVGEFKLRLGNETLPTGGGVYQGLELDVADDNSVKGCDKAPIIG